jgi:hypothetical protein
MPDLTCLIETAQKGDRQADDQLLPLVYDELRKPAAAKMAAEAPGHTLNATARTCKHLRKLRGDSAETARVGSHLPARPAADAAKVAPPQLLAVAWAGEAKLVGWLMSANSTASGPTGPAGSSFPG